MGEDLLDEDQVSELAFWAASGLWNGGREGGSGWRFRGCLGRGRRWSQLGLKLSQAMLLGGAPESVGADLDEAFGQHVLQEAVDEVVGREGEVTEGLSTIIAIAKGDLPLVQSFQAAVNQCHAEDVSGQIIEDLLAATGMTAVDMPLLLPARIVGLEPTESFQASF